MQGIGLMHVLCTVLLSHQAAGVVPSNSYSIINEHGSIQACKWLMVIYVYFCTLSPCA